MICEQSGHHCNTFHNPAAAACVTVLQVWSQQLLGLTAAGWHTSTEVPCSKVDMTQA